MYNVLTGLILFFAFALKANAQDWKVQYDSALVYIEEGKYDKASTLLKDVLPETAALFKSDSTDAAYFHVVDQLGYCAYYRQHYDSAELYFQEALRLSKILEQKDYSANQADLLYNLAALNKERFHYEASEKYYLQTLRMYEVVYGENHSYYTFTLNDLAYVYHSAERYTKAIETLSALADILKQEEGFQSNPEYTFTLRNLGLNHQRLGQYEKAEAFYLEALTLQQEVFGENHPEYATTLNNLGLNYQQMGRYRQAEALHQRTLQIQQETLDAHDPVYSNTLNALATLYFFTGRYGEAVSYYEKALDINQVALGEKHPNYIANLNNLANTFQKMGEYEQAEVLFKKAIRIYKEISKDQPTEYVSMNNLAVVYMQTGQFDKAEALNREVLGIVENLFGKNHPRYATALHNLAKMYLRQGKLAPAQPLFEQTISLREVFLGEKHPDLAEALENYGELLILQKNYEGAEAQFLKAIAIYAESIKSVFPALSEKEKEAFYITVKDIFEKFNTLALMRHADNPRLLSQMYDNHLLTKALLLNASTKVRKNILASGDTSLIRKFENWQLQKDRLARLYRLSKQEVAALGMDIDSIENHANVLEKELSLQSELFAKNNASQDYTWKNVKASLNPDEAAVEIIRFREYEFGTDRFHESTRYTALVINQETAEHPRLALFEDGNAMEGRWLRAYEYDIHNRTEEFGAYAYFWQPLEKALEKVDRVYFSPDGVFNKINVNTLYDLEEDEYLINKTEVRIVTSTKDLLDKDQAETSRQYAVLLGYPNYQLDLHKNAGILSDTVSNSSTLAGNKNRTQIFPELPGTREEVEQILKIIDEKSWITEVYFSDIATEQHIKQIRSPQLLHIATHGFFLEDAHQNETFFQNPLLRSGLLLAGAQYAWTDAGYGFVGDGYVEDGILTAYEAMNLHLDKTELVVLSACDTGLGEIKNGEGVYGLQRAFKMAGARSLMMSLWQVSDEATRELMTHFYDAWLNDQDKHQAFVQAQLALKQKYDAPYFWGAFVMVGE